MTASGDVDDADTGKGPQCSRQKRFSKKEKCQEGTEDSQPLVRKKYQT